MKLHVDVLKWLKNTPEVQLIAHNINVYYNPFNSVVNNMQLSVRKHNIEFTLLSSIVISIISTLVKSILKCTLFNKGWIIFIHFQAFPWP